MAIIAVIKRENGMTNKLNKTECSIIALEMQRSPQVFLACWRHKVLGENPGGWVLLVSRHISEKKNKMCVYHMKVDAWSSLRPREDSDKTARGPEQRRSERGNTEERLSA